MSSGVLISDVPSNRREETGEAGSSQRSLSAEDVETLSGLIINSESND